MAILSAAHSFMGSVSKLRAIDSKGQGAEWQNKERTNRICEGCYGSWWLCSCHSFWPIVVQRNGTAGRSLASEYLQDLEDSEFSDGSKRQQQEDIIKMTLGSIYAGEALYYASDRGSYSNRFSRRRHRSCFPMITHALLTDSHN